MNHSIVELGSTVEFTMKNDLLDVMLAEHARYVEGLPDRGADGKTPPPLVRQMLQKFKLQVHSKCTNKPPKCLDQCAGTGTFIVGLFAMLREAYSNMDPIALFKDSTYACDNDEQKVGHLRIFFVKLLQAVNKKLNLGYNDAIIKKIVEDNIVCGDGLQRKWGMKFDIVVGNPPYKAGMHLKFLQTGIANLETDGCLVFVHPSQWLITKRPDTSRKRELYKLIRNQLSDLKTHVEFIDNAFEEGAGLFGPLCITFCQNVNAHTVRFTDSRNSAYGVKNFHPKKESIIAHLDKVTGWIDGDTEASIIKKVWTSAESENWSKRINKKVGKYFVSLSLLSGNGETSLNDMSGNNVTIHNMYSLGNRFTMRVGSQPQIAKAQSKNGVGNEKRFISLETKEEAENAIRFLMCSKLMRAYIALLKIDQNAANGMMHLIPWMDWSVRMTDEDVYQHFGLDDKEKDVVERIWTMLTGV